MPNMKLRCWERHKEDKKQAMVKLPLSHCIINGQFLKIIYDALVENRPFAGLWFLDVQQSNWLLYI